MLVAALVSIGFGAGCGLFLTDLPTWVSAPAAALACAWGVALARREASRVSESIVLRRDGRVDVDGRPVEAFRLAWQGPLARLEWRCGHRTRRCVAWPDVLDAATRRELRLWALDRDVRASTAAVAP